VSTLMDARTEGKGTAFRIKLPIAPRGSETVPL
jgi:hypothetical protein